MISRIAMFAVLLASGALIYPPASALAQTANPTANPPADQTANPAADQQAVPADPALAAAPLAAARLTYSQLLGAGAIQDIQGRLKALGAFSGNADGAWGNDSGLALQNFQQTHGLQVTGDINPATAATLGLSPAALVGAGPASVAAPPVAAPLATAPPISSPAPAAAAASGQPVFALSANSVRIIQARLRQLRLYGGSIDGLWGGGSLAALQSFQQAHGLPGDGRLTAASVSALGIDPAAMQPQ